MGSIGCECAIHGCQHKFDILRREHDQLINTNNDLDVRLTRAAAALQHSIGNRNQALQTQNQLLIRQVVDITRQNQEFVLKNGRLDTENGRLDTENALLNTQNGRLNTKIEQLEFTNSTLRTQNSSLEALNLSLKLQIEAYDLLEEKYNAALRKAQELEQQLETSTARITALQQKITEQETTFKNTIQAKDRQIADLNSKISLLAQELKQLQNNNNNLEEKLRMANGIVRKFEFFCGTRAHNTVMEVRHDLTYHPNRCKHLLVH